MCVYMFTHTQKHNNTTTSESERVRDFEKVSPSFDLFFVKTKDSLTKSSVIHPPLKKVNLIENASRALCASFSQSEITIDT